MSLAFNTGATAFSGHEVQRRKEIFPVHVSPVMKSPAAVKGNVSTTDLMEKIGKKLKGKNGNIPLAGFQDLMEKIGKKLKGKNGNIPLAAANNEGADIAFNLCVVDTLQRLGIDRYFPSEIHTILQDTFSIWQGKEGERFSDISVHAMAFRLLRVKGYQVSSEELAPYADEDHMNLQTIDVATLVELYRASGERIYEDESILEKIHGWTTTFLVHQLQTNSIPDQKLHKLVEYYLKNYHGILDRVGVRKNLDLYDISHYRNLKLGDRFSSVYNEDFLAFARQDFNICQAQHQKELDQLQRWYADCRLDTLKFGRDALRASNFLASAIISDPELSNVRLAFAKHVVLVALIDDFFDLGGFRQESFKILELVKEWKEKPTAEYGSEEVEILFTALYNTVNELAEMAGVEQGRSVKEFFIELWVQILSIFKMELDTWSDDSALTLDEYLSSSWVSVGCRLCIFVSMQFLGVQLSDEMLMSEECNNLCRHVSMVDRLLNDVQSSQKEREDRGNSVSLLLAAAEKEGRPITEEEAVRKLKEMAGCNRRELMRIVYKSGTILPRKCKDMFLKVCRIGCYLYSSGNEFTSPQQMMEDMKSLVYEPLAVEPDNASGKLLSSVSS